MKYTFSAKVWKYEGKASWYFVTLPKLMSKKIRKGHGFDEEGWGRLKATAAVGTSEWKTSIWHDTKAGGYLLPIKASVRKVEGIKIDQRIKIVLNLQKTDPKVIAWLKGFS